jgi:hypothetical protein
MIIDLLALLIIVGAGATVGALVTIRHRAHLRAETLAEEERLAERQEFYAALATVHGRTRGGLGPSGVDPRDQMLP